MPPKAAAGSHRRRNRATRVQAARRHPGEVAALTFPESRALAKWHAPPPPVTALTMDGRYILKRPPTRFVFRTCAAFEVRAGN